MASTNNILNSASSTSIASTTQTFTVSNSDNTGTSAAQVIISVDPGSSGDPQDSFIVTGVNTWSMGCDNSDSDNFVIAKNAALGTFNSHVITPAGLNRFPLQPCFLAIPTGNQLNATGNGATTYTIGTTVGMTEIFDKGSNFSGTTFTAPVTGQYMFIGSVTLSNCLVNTAAQIQIILSGAGKSAVKTQFRPAAATDISANICYITSMVAGTTAICRVAGIGEATNRNTVVGGTANPVTYFAGYLMC